MYTIETQTLAVPDDMEISETEVLERWNLFVRNATKRETVLTDVKKITDRKYIGIVYFPN